MDLTSDFGEIPVDFECQANLPDLEADKKHMREINKWKKAYSQEKQSHKLTKTVLDQALALSMKLLNEVKTLDVKLYQEQEKNKTMMSQLPDQKPELVKMSSDRGAGTPHKLSEEASGSS